MPITANDIPLPVKPYIANGMDRLKASQIASMLREGEVCLHEHRDKPGHYVVAFRQNGRIQTIDNPSEPLETYFRPPRVPVEGAQLLTRATDWLGHDRHNASAFVATYKLRSDELFSVETLKKQLLPGELCLRASSSDATSNVAVFRTSDRISEVKLDEHSITIAKNPQPISEMVKPGQFRPVSPGDLVERELSKYVAKGESDQSLKNLAGKLQENEFFLHDNGTNGQKIFLCIRLDGRINEMPVNNQQLQEHFKKNKPVEVSALRARTTEITYDTVLGSPQDDNVDRYTITATPAHTVDQLKSQLKPGECCLRDSSFPGQKVLILCGEKGDFHEYRLSADQKNTQSGAPVDLKSYFNSNDWHPVDTATLSERAGNQANHTAKASQRPTLQRAEAMHHGLTAKEYQAQVLQRRQDLHDKQSGQSSSPPLGSGKH